MSIFPLIPRSTCVGGKEWVKGVNIEGEVDVLAVEVVVDFLHDFPDA